MGHYNTVSFLQAMVSTLVGAYFCTLGEPMAAAIGDTEYNNSANI